MGVTIDGTTGGVKSVKHNLVICVTNLRPLGHSLPISLLRLRPPHHQVSRLLRPYPSLQVRVKLHDM